MADVTSLVGQTVGGSQNMANDISADKTGTLSNAWAAQWDNIQKSDASGTARQDVMFPQIMSAPNGGAIMKDWLSTSNATGANNQVLAAALALPGTTVAGSFGYGGGNTGAYGAEDVRIVGASPIYAGGSATHTETFSETVTEYVGTDPRVLASTVKLSKMRDNVYLAYVTGCKPYTRMYVRVNDILWENKCNMPITFKIATQTGYMKGFEDLPYQTDYPDLRFNNGSPSKFNAGEIIDFTWAGGTGTAVCIRHYTRISASGIAETVLETVCWYQSNGTTIPNIVALKNTNFTSIRGRTSNYTATAAGLYLPEGWETGGTGSTSVVADGTGTVTFGFYIPANTINTGKVEIKLTDSQTGQWEYSKSRAKGILFGDGTQHNYTQVVRYHQYTVSWTETVANPVVGYALQFEVEDPLAQSFTIPEQYTSGVMVNSVDLYFHTVTDSTAFDVKVDIIGMTNGYPNQEVYATAVMPQSKLNASSSSLVPTRFTFNKLIYLEPAKEYAIRVMSNSNKYRVWTSKMGEIDITSRTMITQQPSLGSLFKSQNTSTWTAEQYEDLTFQLNIAEFDTSVTGIIQMKPDTRIMNLPVNPFRVFAGSTRARVYHPNHALRVGEYVTYAGSTDTTFNATFTVASVLNSDSYTITLASAKTQDALLGGINVTTANPQVRYDAARLYVNKFVPSGCDIAAAVKGTDESRTIAAGFADVQMNQYFTFGNPYYIMSSTNETQLMSNAKSFTAEYRLTSSNKYLSPAIDLSATGFVTVSNRVMQPAVNDIGTSIHTEDLTEYVTASTNVSFDGTEQKIVSTTDSVANFIEGAYIVVSGSVTNTANNGTFLVTAVDVANKTIYVSSTSGLVTQTAGGGNPITIKQYSYIINSFAPSGDTSEAVYLTDPVLLRNVSTGLKILVDSQIPDGSSVSVWYRCGIGQAATIAKDWTQATSTNVAANNNSGFLERQYDALSLDTFDTVQVKIVKTASNTAKVPLTKNLRMIAVA